MSGPVTVTQADREAAKSLWACEGIGPTMCEIWPQAFARHRQQAEAASAAQVAELREALEEVIDIADSHGAKNYVGSARRIDAARALLSRATAPDTGGV